MELKDFWEPTISVPEELKRPFVDWLSFTVEFTDESWSWLESVFGELRIEEKGFSGYTHTFRTSGEVFGAFSPERKSQKLYVSLSSKALYHFGFGKTSLSDLIQGAIQRKGKFTRIDLAQDDYEGLLDLPLIYEKLKRKEVSTRFRGYTKYESPVHLVESDSLFKDHKIGKHGYTIYIGSIRKSNCFVRIYDKKLQVGGERCAWPVWNRVEFQLSHEAADQYCNPTWNVEPNTGEILKTKERFRDPRRATFGDRSFPKTAYYYLKFLDPYYKQKRNDLGHFYLEETHKRNWGDCSWWTDFLKVSEGQSIGLPKNETGLEQIDNWLKTQASGALRLLTEAHGEEYILEMLKIGEEKMERNPKYQNLLKSFQEKGNKPVAIPFDEVPF
ncbi:replication initiation factor domain-containing protein [Leptospira mayottensis]|uniref:replication initiation factor domain-containing protein n=1 Tax=Leptospira mayottensis TaxID=1137606 RepID=UPI000E35C442|nr:replication initiation factor domain-containing protein [Leptospira mayottensis]AXR69635.1 replication initiation factor [Leptospira mayottensis]AXR69637.1 replication initiation factor [Leptospira mayottensis]